MRHGIRPTAAVLLVSAVGFGLAAQAPEPEPTAQQRSPDGPILGAPPAFDLGDRQERLHLEAETALHQEPAARSPVLVRLDFAAELPVLERRGGWARVRSGGLAGWVALDPAAEAQAGPLLRITASGPDPAALERARSHLRSAAAARQLGPYALYTDVAGERLLAELARLAAGLPESFRRRFGVAAEPGDGETVVLYADEASYRAYVEDEADPSLLDSAGRATDGLAVLYAGDRLPGELRSVLVHEIVHLLTYRALGNDLPPWLAEGLAEDLAYCRVSRTGELVLGSLDTWKASRARPVLDPRGRPAMGVETRTGGPGLALDRLRSEWLAPVRSSLADLLAFSETEFMESDRRTLHYAMSGFWVRYLLADGPPPRHVEAFRSFLAAVARGEAVDAASLRDRLGASWEDLEAGWGKWLRGNGPWRGKR